MLEMREEEGDGYGFTDLTLLTIRVLFKWHLLDEIRSNGAVKPGRSTRLAA